MKSFLIITLLVAAIMIIPRPSQAANDIFWEAEGADDTSMSISGPYRPLSDEESAKLSGGNWLNGNVATDPLFADYTIHAPVAGTWHFFVRKFWQHGAFRWKLDDRKWTEVRDTQILDSVALRQYVVASWVQLDDVSLTAGKHKLRIEIIRDPSYQFGTAFGFDCFLLTQGELTAYFQAHPGISSVSK